MLQYCPKPTAFRSLHQRCQNLLTAHFFHPPPCAVEDEDQVLHVPLPFTTCPVHLNVSMCMVEAPWFIAAMRSCCIILKHLGELVSSKRKTSACAGASRASFAEHHSSHGTSFRPPPGSRCAQEQAGCRSGDLANSLHLRVHLHTHEPHCNQLVVTVVC